MLTVDGIDYDVLIVAGSLKRSFEIAEGPGSLTFLDGDEDPDIIGTYYHYSLTIDAQNSKQAAYDALFDRLSAPVKSHTITLPYGNDELTFEARVMSGDDLFFRKASVLQKWKDMNIEFRAKEPLRRPGDAEGDYTALVDRDWIYLLDVNGVYLQVPGGSNL